MKLANINFGYAVPYAIALTTTSLSVGAAIKMEKDMVTPPPPPVTTTQPTTTSYAAAVDERYLQAKLDLIGSQTDNKFTQLLGEMKLIGTNIAALDHKITSLDEKVVQVDNHTRSAKLTIIASIVGTGLAVAALAWAGVQIFQSGMQITAGAYQSGVAAAPKK